MPEQPISLFNILAHIPLKKTGKPKHELIFRKDYHGNLQNVRSINSRFE
jgi:hypothetical protein